MAFQKCPHFCRGVIRDYYTILRRSKFSFYERAGEISEETKQATVALERLFEKTLWSLKATNSIASGARPTTTITRYPDPEGVASSMLNVTPSGSKRIARR
jgi:hypothetical protein